MVAHCCFKMHFPDNIGCGVSLDMLFAILMTFCMCEILNLKNFSPFLRFFFFF